MRRALLAAALLLPPSAARAEKGTFSDFTDRAVGTTGSEFLNMDIGARGIAMGGAYSAVTNDVYSLYWNPAGLQKIPRLSAGFMYTRYVEDISYQAGAAAWRLNETGVAAAGVRYRDIGSVEKTDIGGNSLGQFHPRDYIIEGGWGQSVLDLSDGDMDVNMGVALRWLYSKYELEAHAFAGDLGVQTRFYSGRWTYDLSFVAQNVGMGQRFDQTRDTLPTRLRLGGAISPVRPVTLSVDLLAPVNNRPHLALGGEYAWEPSRGMKAAVRGGFNTLTVDSLGLSSTLSFGWGLALTDVSFDYSFSPFGVLGTGLHRVSISYNLPAKVSRRYRER